MLHHTGHQVATVPQVDGHQQPLPSRINIKPSLRAHLAGIHIFHFCLTAKGCSSACTLMSTSTKAREASVPWGASFETQGEKNTWRISPHSAWHTPLAICRSYLVLKTKGRRVVKLIAVLALRYEQCKWHLARGTPSVCPGIQFSYMHEHVSYEHSILIACQVVCKRSPHLTGHCRSPSLDSFKCIHAPRSTTTTPA